MIDPFGAVVTGISIGVAVVTIIIVIDILKLFNWS
ncbi:hypothetical protein EVB79_011 [Rhizobium phage RHph_N3_13]|nr:hypothetical protein EVB79_011 [Rhizobium phage RHph_N3_13]QIG69839.1 hypothetical protein F67_I3_11_013 [Rhizobium phage RHph_I3_11]